MEETTRLKRTDSVFFRFFFFFFDSATESVVCVPFDEFSSILSLPSFVSIKFELAKLNPRRMRGRGRWKMEREIDSLNFLLIQEESSLLPPPSE